MRVALVQFAATLDVDDNLATIARLTQGVEADLIVLPEAAMHDFGSPTTSLADIAQPLDGPFAGHLAELAQDKNATVIGGMFERAPDRPYNTTLVVDSDGNIEATYRKIHLYDSFGYRESERVQPGVPEATVVDIGGLTVGLMTCYDLRFPEHARALIDEGADALIVPSAWLEGPLKLDHWTTLVKARAIENTVYVVAAAQSAPTYVGHSTLVDPLGVVESALGSQEGVGLGVLDPAKIAAARSRNPALQHRRFQLR